MTTIDLEKLIEWLGPDGAMAGLEASDITVSELNQLATRSGVSVEKKMRREDIIVEIVNSRSIRIDKTNDELLAMNLDELKLYLKTRKASRIELLNLLSKFDIYPGSEARKNLLEFVAREISDLGMYQRVAKGTRRV